MVFSTRYNGKMLLYIHFISSKFCILRNNILWNIKFRNDILENMFGSI